MAAPGAPDGVDASVTVTAADIDAAAAGLVGMAHRTPVLTSSRLDELVGATVIMKAEHLQRTGSFKLRGAWTAVAAAAAGGASGVVAFSSGNHAGAVAYSARRAGLPAVIVMPADVPAAKLAATRGYGAEVVFYQRATEDRAVIARAVAEERGAVVVPPFDSPLVIAGQGTVGLELAEDAGPLDLLLVCCSGGGLTAGCAIAVHHRTPGTQVVAVEPAAGDDTVRSLAAGHRVRLAQPQTIADGLATQSPGELTFPILQAHGVRAVSVSDQEILAAMRFLLEGCKQVVEPSGAAALAALLAGRVGDVTGKRVGVTLSGGNLDAARLVALLG